MADDAVKRLILVRRAKFVAAALASVSAVTQAGACSPQPCLEPSPTPPVDAGKEASLADAAGTIAPDAEAK